MGAGALVPTELTAELTSRSHPGLQECEDTQAELILPDASPQTSFRFSGSQAQPLSPSPCPQLQQPHSLPEFPSRDVSAWQRYKQEDGEMGVER